jgi:hypothetical protein
MSSKLVKDMIQKQKDLRLFLEEAEKKLDDDGGLGTTLVELNDQQEEFMNSVYVSYIHISLPLVTYTLFDAFN